MWKKFHTFIPKIVSNFKQTLPEQKMVWVQNPGVHPFFV